MPDRGYDPVEVKSITGGGNNDDENGRSKRLKNKIERRSPVAPDKHGQLPIPVPRRMLAYPINGIKKENGQGNVQSCYDQGPTRVASRKL